MGDWFPIWSTTDNYGLGSPLPALYHKLFYLFSGMALVLTGNVKVSVLISLWIWFVIGGLGMYWLCRQMNCPKAVSWAGSVMLITANYTVTDWLIRGAMAELCAIMLIPWTLLFYIRCLYPNSQTIKNNAFLGICLGLTFLAHSVIAYYLVLLFSVSTLLILIVRHKSVHELQLHRNIFSIFFFTCTVIPYLAVMYVFRGVSNAGRLIIPPFLPEYSIKPITDYFWDSTWHWGATWASYTVQLDQPLLLLFLCGMLVVAIQRAVVKFKGATTDAVFRFDNGSLSLLSWIGICLILQTPIAVGFYRFFPYAAYLQFPWRLLGVLTPALIALSLHIWSSCKQLQKIIHVVSGICLLAMIYLCGAWAPIHYAFIPYEKTQLSNLILGWNGVYMPPQMRVRDSAPLVNLSTVGPEMERQDHIFILSTLSEQAQSLKKSNCAIQNHAKQNTEALVQAFILQCSNPGQIPLPIIASPWHRVRIQDSQGDIARIQKCIALDAFPGICGISIPHPGSYQLLVYTPTFSGQIQEILENHPKVSR